MRVLHLPVNISSQVSITVRALRDIGIDARGLVVNNSPIQESEGIETVEVVSRRRHPVSGLIQTLFWWNRAQSAIRWADVVHWHFGYRVLPGDLELKYVASQNKVRVVEFWGSDIRIPEIAAKDNPYFQRLLKDPTNDYQISYSASRKKQERFARNGFECLIPSIEMMPYVQRDLFPSPTMTQVRVLLSDYDPKYPDPSNIKPVIVHTPSNLMVKGTPSVIRAMDQLQDKFDFKFKLIHNLPHSETMNIVRDCDIMLDQFVAGGHGVAALEAMALGKPVVCYVKPSLLSEFPSDYPVINASQDNIIQVVGNLLADGQRRHEVGRQSRAYVERHHDAHQIARQLVNIYQELAAKRLPSTEVN